jgi:hypothetical protein
MNARALAGSLLVFLGPLAGCISSSVIESSGRAVDTALDDIRWRPAEPVDLDGLFESVSIEGEVAAALWKLSYCFTPDAPGAARGEYTGAALVIGGPSPAFQTLSGRWQLENGELDLGEGERASASASDEHLRLESEGGVAVLRRAGVR